MTKFLNRLVKLLSYQEPPSIEGGVELKEDRSEENQPENQTNGGQNKNPKQEKKRKRNKFPFRSSWWGDQQKSEGSSRPPNEQDGMVHPSLQIDLDTVKQLLHVPKNKDVIIREFRIDRKLDAFLLYIDGMADRNTINDYMLRQLMNQKFFQDFTGGCPLEFITQNVLTVHHVSLQADYLKTINKVMNGSVALFVEGCSQCLITEAAGYEKRPIGKPLTETIIRGSQEGFTENLKTKISQIRRFVRNRDLVSEMLPLGKTDHSTCAIMYMAGITNPQLIQEVKRRISNLDVDFVMGAGTLEELISDRPYSLFPDITTSERPDRAASFLLDGKVVIVTEGSPFITAVPGTFYEMMISSEESFLKWQFATVLRGIRLLAILTTTLLSAVYVALTTYHQEMIPTDLLISIAAAKENVPFTTLVEMLVMEISFELIREAGLRVPGVIGQTLGIIGALILGQAAVQAGIVTPIMIIIVAVSGLGSFAIPNYSLAFAFRVLKFMCARHGRYL